MKAFNTITFCLLVFFAANVVSAQTSFQNGLEFKIQLIDGNTYGVYVKPNSSISPSSKTQAGSGQVTLVTPVGFAYSNLQNISGTWIENARVDAPAEANDKSYISFGFVTDEPRIKLFPNEETLLFTFTCNATSIGQVALFDNNNDPFMTPNSYNSNPGNDLGIIDLGAKGGTAFYNYAGNYSTDSEDMRNLAALAKK